MLLMHSFVEQSPYVSTFQVIRPETSRVDCAKGAYIRQSRPSKMAVDASCREIEFDYIRRYCGLDKCYTSADLFATPLLI